MHIRQGTVTFERYRVVDAETGAEIADVVEADDGEGWYRVLKRLPNGEPATTDDNRFVHTRRYGAIRIEKLPDEEAAAEEPAQRPRRGKRSDPDC